MEQFPEMPKDFAFRGIASCNPFLRSKLYMFRKKLMMFLDLISFDNLVNDNIMELPQMKLTNKSTPQEAGMFDYLAKAFPYNLGKAFWYLIPLEDRNRIKTVDAFIKSIYSVIERVFDHAEITLIFERHFKEFDLTTKPLPLKLSYLDYNDVEEYDEDKEDDQDFCDETSVLPSSIPTKEPSLNALVGNSSFPSPGGCLSLILNGDCPRKKDGTCRYEHSDINVLAETWRHFFMKLKESKYNPSSHRDKIATVHSKPPAPMVTGFNTANQKTLLQRNTPNIASRQHFLAQQPSNDAQMDGYNDD
jgi:hypothetical protein